MRILLTGKNGQVGHELQHLLPSLGTVVALGREELDLTSADAIRKTMRDVRPGIVVNAAAYTAVDLAEQEPDKAFAINGTAPGLIAEEARRTDAFVVHYSTDYVFDGSQKTPYLETDMPNPLSAYGHSKVAGENAIRASGAAHFIFRTSWIYAAHGRNFVHTILRLARERDELKIVDDQIGAPTWARTVAETTCAALKAQYRDRSGLYHLTAAGSVTWFGFAKAILDEAKTLQPDLRMPALIPISTSEYPLPTPRPANSCLDNTRLHTTLGLFTPDWPVSLTQCMREILSPCGN
ncbi:MAG: dTDP-4-dehydrorhamnose reductase [Burkholderiales bacterium]|nr:dTDP-4-dehydrorhamnose reductase [Burkholderiales bacterium]